MKDLFDEIEVEKKPLPKLKKISKEVTKTREHNFYQKLAYLLFIFFFITGIILGNIFPACTETSTLFKTCTNTEYNLALTLIFWLVSFVFCSLIYGFGEIIKLLTIISEKK